ncbi:MAG TPA: radical SAM protein [Dongiaceae bacterium]|nr:radical SAM protein [Dongiaceae bacterium]
MSRQKPTFVSYNLTSECNESCPMCSVRQQDGDVLSLAELERILGELRRSGFRVVELSGGEPLLRSDMTEVFALLDRLDLFSTITTNGTLLTKATIEQLRNVRGLLQLAISLDSLDPETYARLRGRDLLPDVLRGVDLVAGAGLPMPFKLNMTMSRLNYHETLDILSYARKRRGYLSVFPVSLGSGFQHRADDALFRVDAQERRDMAEIFRKLALMRRQGEPLWEFSGFYEMAADYVLGLPVGTCDSGRLYLDLHADGKLAACIDQPAFADLRTESVPNALRRLEAENEEIRRCSTESPCCYTCTYNISLTARHLLAFLRETAVVRWRAARRTRAQKSALSPS